MKHNFEIIGRKLCRKLSFLKITVEAIRLGAKMDAREFAHVLLNSNNSIPRNEILEEEVTLASAYLGQLMMLHKYIDFLKDQDNQNSNLKKIQIFNLTRIVEGFVTSNHLLDSRYYNSALTELRVVYETLNIIKMISISPEYLQTYLSQDALKILKEFQPLKIRTALGSTPYDVIHNFLISYQTHPFYTGNEFLLSVDLSSKSSRGIASRIYHPTLDIVVALMILITYLHTYFQVSTGFGIGSIIPADRDTLIRMYTDVERFAKKYYVQVKDHRFMNAVLEDFMRKFVGLIDANVAEAPMNNRNK